MENACHGFNISYIWHIHNIFRAYFSNPFYLHFLKMEEHLLQLLHPLHLLHLFEMLVHPSGVIHLLHFFKVLAHPLHSLHFLEVLRMC
jgi:hypothetical protein